MSACIEICLCNLPRLVAIIRMLLSRIHFALLLCLLNDNITQILLHVFGQDGCEKENPILCNSCFAFERLQSSHRK